MNISAKNITDKRYSEAYEYKAPGESFSFYDRQKFLMEKNIKISIGILLALAMSRFIPHPPNFTSLIALSFLYSSNFWLKILTSVIDQFCNY